MRLMLKSDKADRILRPVACVLLACCAAVFVLSMIYYKAKPAFMEIAVYPAVLLVVCWLLRGEYRARPVYWLAVVFVVWYGVTRLLIKDIYGRQPFYYYVELVLIYLFAFPFARTMNERSRVLDWLAGGTVLVVTAASILGLCVVLGGRPISLSGERYTSEMVDGRLWLLSHNPNITSIFVLLSMLLTVYLMLRCRKRWAHIAGSLVLVVNYLTLVATDSRTTKIALLACVAVAGALVASRLFKRPFRGRVAAIAVVALGAMLLCYFGYELGLCSLNNVAEAIAQLRGEEAAVPMVAGREMVDTRGNGRITIYTCFYNYLKDHSSVLLTGANNFSIRLMSCYERKNATAHLMMHLHNAFFQTLAETGVIGLALVLAICVFLLIYSLRVLFSTERTMAEKMLPVLLLALIVDALAESPIFVPYDEATNSFLNLLFFLCSGYVVELGMKSKRLGR